MPHADEWLAREDVQHRFAARASAAEVAELAGLKAATGPQSRTRALELVLLRLTAKELFDLGITQVEQPDGLEWMVASSDDSDAAIKAVGNALDAVGIGGFGSSNHGRTGWYGPREQFFRARGALLRSPDVQKLGVSVIDPKLRR